MDDETVAGGIDYGHFGTPHPSGTRLTLEYIQSLGLEEKAQQFNTTEVEDFWKTVECLILDKEQNSRRSRSKSTGQMDCVEQNKENVPPSRRNKAVNDATKDTEDTEQEKVIKKRGRPPKSAKVPCSPKVAESEAVSSPNNQHGSTPTKKPGGSAKKNTKAKTSNSDGSNQLPAEGQPTNSNNVQKASRKRATKSVDKPADSQTTDKEQLKKPRGRPRKSSLVTENKADSQQQLDTGNVAGGGTDASEVDVITQVVESLSFVGPSQGSLENHQLVKIQALNQPEKPAKTKKRAKSSSDKEMPPQPEGSVETQNSKPANHRRRTIIPAEMAMLPLLDGSVETQSEAENPVKNRRRTTSLAVKGLFSPDDIGTKSKQTVKILDVNTVNFNKEEIELIRGGSDPLAIAGASQVEQLSESTTGKQSNRKSPIRFPEQLDTSKQPDQTTTASSQRVPVGKGAVKKASVHSTHGNNPSTSAQLEAAVNESVNSNASS